ncbi:helix-turn-helix domain-containing protein [Planomonospora sphaerica]|nr:hypothetical protein [Planomonospora sphaerica]
MSFTDRLRTAGLSLWELGDLLGIHPHEVHGHDRPYLNQRTVEVLIEIARRLDMHPADLVPDLESVLRNRRIRRPESAPEPDPDDDALAVAAALVAADIALSADALADVLDWPLARAQTALDHLQAHPHLAGPLALRRVPPHAYTLTARLDILTADQHRAAIDATRHHATLSEQEAIVVLSVLIGQGRLETALNDLDAATYQRIETTLKHAGILYSDTGPHRVYVHDDVFHSLRYRNYSNSPIPDLDDEADSDDPALARHRPYTFLSPDRSEPGQP